MKKITFLILLFSSIASFSQEQVMLDIDLLLTNNGNGNLRVSNSSGQTLYDSYGAGVDNYGMIINLSIANFPLTINWRPGIYAGCTIPQNFTYTYSDYVAGTILSGGCAPEYFYIKSPYINQLTPSTSTVGVCENITLQSGNRHYYSTDGTTWNSCSYKFTPASILGSGFRGSLKIKSDIDSFHAVPKVTMQSKVITYTVIGCSPELDGQPIADKTKCKYESSGSVTLKFKTELKDGDKFLFNIFKNGIFDKSTFVTKDQIINLTYTWSGLAEGSYFIKYQSQTTTDSNTIVGATAITTDPFVVGSPDPLTFTITQLQPKCHDEQGAVQISASGGTSPYYYMIDSETLLQKHPLTANPIQLSEGPHKITVVDSNSCIEK
ncbi:hypothetical protein [Flavobacterium chilense]|uniref:SprB repeat-containing protein n=1 Tax=Flavobacterium chilense TaxID=946677 RepID=A0A1M6YK06_9FLAO|nr:hypothetical protein [Flavobacterium chilense]SHL18349.1 hypothetical protein SAMN05444484_101607 [Flavobacterium chilense]